MSFFSKIRSADRGRRHGSLINGDGLTPAPIITPTDDKGQSLAKPISPSTSGSSSATPRARAIRSGKYCRIRSTEYAADGDGGCGQGDFIAAVTAAGPIS